MSNPVDKRDPDDLVDPDTQHDPETPNHPDDLLDLDTQHDPELLSHPNDLIDPDTQSNPETLSHPDDLFDPGTQQDPETLNHADDRFDPGAQHDPETLNHADELFDPGTQQDPVSLNHADDLFDPGTQQDPEMNLADDRLFDSDSQHDPEMLSHADNLFEPDTSKEPTSKLTLYLIGAAVVVAGLGLAIFGNLGDKKDQSQPISGVTTPASPPATSSALTGKNQASPASLAATQKAANLPAASPKLILRLHGSNIEGIRLAPDLVTGYLRQIGATETLTVPTQDSAEEYIQGYLPNTQEAVAVEIFAHGSGTSFKDLATRKADIAMSSIPIKTKERRDLKPLFGDLASEKNEIVVASDGLAIIVHLTNPIQSLTTKQIAGLLSGDITDWSQAGGYAGPVNVHARDDLSGAFDTIQHFVLRPHNKRLSNSAKRYESVTALADAVANDRSGIGFVGLPFAQRAKTIAVADADDVEPLLPTFFTVATEDYPLTRRLYFYVPDQSANPHARGIVDFALSQAGQTIVEREGFVSHILHTTIPAITRSMPDSYVSFIKNAERLSLNFRFKSGSSDLDSKSKHDFGRLLRYMQTRADKRLMLFGFADSVGSAERNLQLSEQRAGVVKRMLAARNIDTPVVKGYGEVLPVASNSTEEGRSHNRRVEVWIK